MRKTVLLILILLYALDAVSQTRADSLFHVYETTNGKIKEDAVRAFAKEVANADIEKIKDYGLLLQETSKKNNDKLALAIALNMFGTYHYNKGQYTLAESYFNQSLIIREELNDKIGLPAAYNNMGNIRMVQGDYKKAIEYHLLSLKIKEELKDEKGIAMSYNNIANAYRMFKQPKKAIEYHKLSLGIKEKLGDKRGTTYSLANIANAYFENGQKNEAVAYYNKALKLQHELNDELQLGNTYNSIGYVALKDQQYVKAAEYFQKSLKYHLKTNNRNGIATTYMNIGELYILQDSLNKAERYLNKSLLIARENNDKENIQEVQRKLSIIAEKEKDYKKALGLMQASQNVKDSLFSIDNQMAIAEMQTKYETEKKEAAIKLLEKENELKDSRNRQQLYIASGIIILLTVAAIFSYVYLKTAQQKRLANEWLAIEKERLSTVIQTQENERKRISAELHDGIGPLLSAVKMNVSMLNYSDGSADRHAATLSLIDKSYNELRHISHTMMPAMLAKCGLSQTLEELILTLNKTGKTEINFYTDEDSVRYSEQVEINIYRIVQELLNNIIKYANASEITIQLGREGNELSLMIEDNGDGFDVNNLHKSKGNGWANIQSRLNLLGGSIEIDSQPGKKGTVVHLIVAMQQQTVA